MSNNLQKYLASLLTITLAWFGARSFWRGVSSPSLFMGALIVGFILFNYSPITNTITHLYAEHKQEQKEQQIREDKLRQEDITRKEKQQQEEKEKQVKKALDDIRDVMFEKYKTALEVFLEKPSEQTLNYLHNVSTVQQESKAIHKYEWTDTQQIYVNSTIDKLKIGFKEMARQDKILLDKQKDIEQKKKQTAQAEKTYYNEGDQHTSKNGEIYELRNDVWVHIGKQEDKKYSNQEYTKVNKKQQENPKESLVELENKLNKIKELCIKTGHFFETSKTCGGPASDAYNKAAKEYTNAALNQ